MLTGALQLGLRHARHHLGRTVIMVLCVAAATCVPLATRVLSAAFESHLRARAASTPLLVGDRSSRFDLVFASLYFRRPELPTVCMADWRRLVDKGGCTAIPLNVRFTARGHPILATTIEYAQLRGLHARTGTLPLMLGECTLGSEAARALGLKPGDFLFSDQRELYDIAKPPSLRMAVAGVLAPTGTSDDGALFTDIQTAWILEGLSHSHADKPAKVPGDLVLENSGGNIALSEAFVAENQVTQANIAGYHLHAPSESLPLTAILVVPDSERDATLIKARVNAGRSLQAVTPTAVIDELLGYVIRVRALLDGVAIMLAGVTCALLALITTLSVQVRSRELDTLRRIGASRGLIALAFACEIAAILLVGLCLAAGCCAALWIWAPDPVKFL